MMEAPSSSFINNEGKWGTDVCRCSKIEHFLVKNQASVGFFVENRKIREWRNKQVGCYELEKTTWVKKSLRIYQKYCGEMGKNGLRIEATVGSRQSMSMVLN
jgi:hypothetical protein